MKYLYLDTTSNFLYTGVVENNSLICERKVRFDKDLSTMALTTMVKMLEEKDIKPTDINKIILVNGPGSFTGCRIGITIAKTFAWSLNIPITTISSLEAMALSNEEYDFFIPVLDARRDFVFSGIYDKDNNQIMKNQYVKKSVLETAINNIFIGRSWIKPFEDGNFSSAMTTEMLKLSSTPPMSIRNTIRIIFLFCFASKSRFIFLNILIMSFSSVFKYTPTHYFTI